MLRWVSSLVPTWAASSKQVECKWQQLREEKESAHSHEWNVKTMHIVHSKRRLFTWPSICSRWKVVLHTWLISWIVDNACLSLSPCFMWFSGRSSKSLASLEQELFITQIEIRQLQLNLMHSKALAHYGWRENLNQRMNAWRSSLRSVFSRIAASFRTFITSLTTREGDRLPPWVYSAFSGALDDVLKYLEKQMEEQDDHFRATLLELLRNTVRIYRNKIRNSGTTTSAATNATTDSVTSNTTGTTGATSPGDNSSAAAATAAASQPTGENTNASESESNRLNRVSPSKASLANDDESNEIEGKDDHSDSWAEIADNWDRELHEDTLDFWPNIENNLPRHGDRWKWHTKKDEGERERQERKSKRRHTLEKQWHLHFDRCCAHTFDNKCNCSRARDTVRNSGKWKRGEKREKTKRMEKSVERNELYSSSSAFVVCVTWLFLSTSKVHFYQSSR